MNTPIQTMRMGRENPPAAVAKLSMWLRALGYYSDTLGTIDAVFGAPMHAALMEFQRRNGLTVDGIFGMRSFAAMRRLIQEQARARMASEFPEVRISSLGAAECPALEIPKGMKVFTFRPDVAYFFMRMTRELEALGVRLPSAGGVRALTAKVTQGRIPISMHYPGLAFDIHTGAAMNNPNTDLFVVEHIGDRNWRVWARSQDERVPMRTIANPFTYTRRAGTGVPVTGRFVDFTAIADKWHFKSIKGRTHFFDTTRTDGSVYALAEWWHFQNEFFIMEGFSTFGEELQALYGEEELARRAPVRIRNNYSATFGVTWN